MRVHDRETVWKAIGAERFLDPRGGETLASDGNCWLAWDCTIKESEVRRPPVFPLAACGSRGRE